MRDRVSTGHLKAPLFPKNLEIPVTSIFMLYNIMKMSCMLLLIYALCASALKSIYVFMTLSLRFFYLNLNL